MTQSTTGLVELKALAAKATPGPWKARIWPHPGADDTVCIKDTKGREIIHWGGFDGVPCTKAQIHANAKLIAKIPTMIHLLSAQETTIAELVAALEQFRPACIEMNNPNIRDDFIVPLDVTMGELRMIEAALTKSRSAL